MQILHLLCCPYICLSPPTVIRSENGVFEPKEFEKRQRFIFVQTENILKTELSDDDDITIICNFFARVFLNHKFKMTGDCCVFCLCFFQFFLHIEWTGRRNVKKAIEGSK